MQTQKLSFLVQAAMIAAIYVALTLIFQAVSFGEIQVRVSEALTILPLFTPAAVPGLFVGCLIGNILGGAMLPDILFGSLATLIGAVGTYRLRRRKPILGPLPPILANIIVVPPVLKYAYGTPLPIPLMMLTVGIGEALSCGMLGLILYFALKKYARVIFKSPKKVSLKLDPKGAFFIKMALTKARETGKMISVLRRGIAKR